MSKEKQSRKHDAFMIGINKNNIYVTGHAIRNFIEHELQYKGMKLSFEEARARIEQYVIHATPQKTIFRTKEQGGTILLIGENEHLIVNLNETETHPRNGERTTLSVLTHVGRERNKFWFLSELKEEQPLEIKDEDFNFNFMEENRS